MEEQIAKLQTKLKLLNFTAKKTDSTIAKADIEVSERLCSSIKAMIKAVSDVKETIEEQKFKSGATVEIVSEWSDEIEQQIEFADEQVRKITNQIREINYEFKQAEDVKKRDAQLEFERAQVVLQQQHEKHERDEQIAQEAKILDQKLQYQKLLEESQTSASVPKDGVQAKLPKLQITKFNGQFSDWLRFWNQFIAIIDSQNISPITKFSYLKEHLDPKVKRSIDGLPFTDKGYTKAKEILVEKYANESEIVNSYVEEIISLPTINGSQPGKIHSFFETLRYNVQSLETLNKLSDVNGYVRMTINKLPSIRGDLVRTDPKWKDWTFVKLCEALRDWTERNPVENNQSEDKRRDRYAKAFNTQQKKDPTKPRACVYCDSMEHKSTTCSVVSTPVDRKKILAQKKLCYNCAGGSHRAAECRSTTTCLNCGKRHHTSICDPEAKLEMLKSAHQADESEVIYPVVLLEIDGIKTRALLHTGAGSSYASARLINALHKQPTETKTKRIEMMLGSTITKVEIYNVKVKSIDGDFTMDVNVTKVDKPQLMHLDNPNYETLLKNHSHLNGVQINDVDVNPHLPVHVVLGASEYAAIKTKTAPRIGSPGQPIAEKTLLGWTIMSPGREVDTAPLLLTSSTSVDFDQLCSLDVLGLADSPAGDQLEVYQEFKEQLTRSPEGWYETGLPWKGNHPELPTNKTGSIRRLQQLVKKLERDNNYTAYDNVIQEQIEQGVVEVAPAVVVGNEFYLPHKAVIRQQAESSKLRVVYDASAKERGDQPSLNDCLQNLLWTVLVRNRIHPVAITGHLQKAFLQVRIREAERDALRFHWKPPGQSNIEVYRFTRALFGLTSSPFLLCGVINQHLTLWEVRYPEFVEEIRKSLYVDDLLSGGATVQEAQTKKSKAKEIFQDAKFNLHKWHSNESELELDNDAKDGNDELSYAKQQLGTTSSETKLLGLPWDKENDTLRIEFPQVETEPTKRGVLSTLAKVYDPLGLVSPTTLSGKLIFRDISDEKLAWDTELPEQLQKLWNKWYNNLPVSVTIPRSIAPHQQPIQELTLHAFGDASGKGVSAVVYAVVKQDDGVAQNIVTAKSRLAKRGLTIPRLELIAGHMAANLITNVQQAIQPIITADLHCWLDSTVALFWILGTGEYKQFVANRVNKIRQHSSITCHHVPTAENPADLGSRGGSVVDAPLWRYGPHWLADPDKWPPNITLISSASSNAEAKITKDIFAAAVNVQDTFDELLSKHELWKVLRIGAWVQRFIHNCKATVATRESGPLTTTEIENHKTWWIKRVQRDAQTTAKFEKDKLQLNLQINQQQILECRGCLEGEYPIYLPDDHPFTSKLLHQAHLATLHGGVGLTMARIRELYWVPRLRRLVKKVRGKCWGCKRFRTKAFQSPPPCNLPRTRTSGNTPYEVIGVDFAGPIMYRTKSKVEKKSYLALYGCSLTRGVFLDLLPSLNTEEFIISLKRFVARHGRPKLIYSDNGGTFKAAAKWLKEAQISEKFNDYLAQHSITWQLNLSRAPWWGGQFERLIGLFKNAFYKTIGNATLRWSELEELVLDVEIALNNRPLPVELNLTAPEFMPRPRRDAAPAARLRIQNNLNEEDND